MGQERHAELNWLSRAEIQSILEDQYGTACFDDEPTSDLRECLREQWAEDEEVAQPEA